MAIQTLNFCPSDFRVFKAPSLLGLSNSGYKSLKWGWLNWPCGVTPFLWTRKPTEIHSAASCGIYERRSLDFDFDEALRDRQMAPIFAGLVKLPMYRTDETLWNSWGTSMHLPTEVAWHEYFLEIVATGSKKLFMDFSINFGSLIQPIKIFNCEWATVSGAEYLQIVSEFVIRA